MRCPRARSRQTGSRYTVNDGFGNVSTTTLTITVVGRRFPASTRCVANADVRTVLSSTPATAAGNVVFGGAVGELADTDSQFHTITVQGATQGATSVAQSGRLNVPIAGSYGDLVIQANGSYVYTLNAAGQALPLAPVQLDRFTYTVNDNSGNVATTTLTITRRRPEGQFDRFASGQCRRADGAVDHAHDAGQRGLRRVRSVRWRTPTRQLHPIQVQGVSAGVFAIAAVWRLEPAGRGHLR
jgi:VCBS repeat-containing protein